MRERLSQEVRQILKSQGTTGILVTHDQMEAFAVGDQIAVMDQGQILQKTRHTTCIIPRIIPLC